MKTQAAPRSTAGRIQTAKIKLEQAEKKYGSRHNKTIAFRLAYSNLIIQNN